MTPRSDIVREYTAAPEAGSSETPGIRLHSIVETWLGGAVIMLLLLVQISVFFLPGLLLQWWRCGSLALGLWLSLTDPTCLGLDLLWWTGGVLLLWALLHSRLPSLPAEDSSPETAREGVEAPSQPPLT